MRLKEIVNSLAFDDFQLFILRIRPLAQRYDIGHVQFQLAELKRLNPQCGSLHAAREAGIVGDDEIEIHRFGFRVGEVRPQSPGEPLGK